ncbi:MAG: hypothetical protein ACFE0O_10000, partial [Opitutales bacterium]
MEAGDKTPPVWWGDWVWEPAPDRVGYAPATQGQLKWFATEAHTYLTDRLKLSAKAWEAAFAPHPVPFPLQPTESDGFPASMRDLKIFAEAFYRVLESADYPVHWSINHYGSEGGSDLGRQRPWPAEASASLVTPSPSSDAGSGFAPVTLGQLQYALSFTTDLDNDGLEDHWEAAVLASPGGGSFTGNPRLASAAAWVGPDGDLDGDGLSNRQEAGAWVPGADP